MSSQSPAISTQVEEVLGSDGKRISLCSVSGPGRPWCSSIDILGPRSGLQARIICNREVLERLREEIGRRIAEGIAWEEIVWVGLRRIVLERIDETHRISLTGKHGNIIAGIDFSEDALHELIGRIDRILGSDKTYRPAVALALGIEDRSGRAVVSGGS